MNSKLPHDHGNTLEELVQVMPSTEAFNEAASFFNQIGDGTRLKIFWILCHTQECGINLAAIIGMSTAAISHHLKSLKLKKLIQGKRIGKEVYYTKTDTPVANLLHEFIDKYFELVNEIAK
ncbi:ArsR/SmtB family transcription factor [Fundicoccus culcitae]|uniref:Metalloregulator ArsR/SmtB family transcription factor n=1 Tax=Fundicoccus culcitae TaxID=2969821 RepID=A0ABY5P6D0_9LACT|nr:metalloregulator ArsR/SmtB family transcription factor [Fundicoccus culcitae]UUX34281.1 metalloregulator ArsR/SmtB family transcription factor [Fundicoccus culcitae]